MNKKLFAFIFTIAFSLVTVLGCFSTVSVSASTISLTDDDYTKAAQVLTKICPGFPLAESEVTTRAEFVAAVTMVMNITANAGVETSFRDVPESHPYSANIAYAANMGLINTVDLFYPDSPVTYSQAIKIVMVAAGYGEKAEYTGGYPTGYLMVANEADVGQGINLADTENISHAQAIRIIFEAAITDMLEVTSFGDSYDYSITEGKNILSTYHKVYMAQGVVESNENTALTSATSISGDDIITIDGVNFYAPGYENLIGKSARVFYGDDSKNTVVFAYESGNNIDNYTERDNITISGTNLSVISDESDKEIRHSLESDYSLIYNGKFYGSADYNTVVNPKAGSVSLVDNDNNSRVDVVIVKDVEYGIIGSVNEFDEKIYDKYKEGGLLDISDSSVKYMVTEADGTAIALDDLEEDDVVGYAVSKDKKLYEIIRYSERVGGTYDSKTSDGKLEMKGEEYQLSDYYINNIKSIDNIKFGSEVILHLGVGNQVVYVQEFTTSLKYGFVVASGQESGLDGDLLVKIYGGDGIMYELAVADKIKLNGTTKTKSEAKAVIEAIDSKEAVLRVVKYSVNSEGKLNKLFEAVDNTAGTGALVTPNVDEAAPVLYSRNTAAEHGNPSLEGKLMYKNGTFYPLFHLGTATEVIQVPLTEDYRMDEDYYTSHTTTTLASATDDAENQPFYGYDVHNGCAGFVLWTKDGSGVTEVGEGGSAIIEAVTSGVNEDGEAVKVFKAYFNKTWTKFYSKSGYSETETALRETVDKIQPGDIVQISLNSKNEITAASINFSYIGDDTNGPRYTNPTNKNGSYSAKVVGFETGYILTNADKKAMLVRDKSMEDIVSGNYTTINTVAANLARGTVLFVKFNRNRNTNDITDAVVYSESDTNVAESFFTAGTNADYLVQRSRYNDVSLTVIYTN